MPDLTEGGDDDVGPGQEHGAVREPRAGRPAVSSDGSHQGSGWRFRT
jgi:hypothetical protein